MEKLIARALEGDHRSIARLISLVESESPQAEHIMRRIYAHSGKAHIIGLTGSPGAGKSTLADKVIAAFKSLGKTIGVIAVDPSSPFPGGAIRMSSYAAWEPGAPLAGLAAPRRKPH